MSRVSPLIKSRRWRVNEPPRRLPRSMKRHPTALRLAFFILFIAFVNGCATLPPGSDFHKQATAALAHPEETRLGHQFEAAATKHGGHSGYRLLSAGIDGLLTR